MSDATAELWEELRRKGQLLSSEDAEDWSYAHEEGVIDDLVTLAAAQGLEVVETDEGIWLVAHPSSRYAVRLSAVMRGEPSRETRALVSYASLVTLSRVFDPSRLVDDLFVTPERVRSQMDEWADSIVANPVSTREANEVAKMWRAKPLGEDAESEGGARANVTTKQGIVLYAFRYLEESGWLEELSDRRWRSTARARALWPRYAEIGAFAEALRARGIELDGGRYA